MAIHSFYDVAFLMDDGTIKILKTANPTQFITKHLHGSIRSTAGKIVKVVGYKEVYFDTEDSVAWCDALLAEINSARADAEPAEAVS